MCTGTCRRLWARRKVDAAAAVLLLAACLLAGCNPVVSQEARRRFQSRTGPFTVTVFPVHISAGSRTEEDREMASRLAAFLEREDLAHPVVSDRPVEIPAYPGISETKRIRLSARSVQRAVRHVDLETEYALAADIVWNRERTRVLGVYFYLSDRFARIASARMANAHHREFRKINPKSRQGAFEVLTEMIREGWLPSRRAERSFGGLRSRAAAG